MESILSHRGPKRLSAPALLPRALTLAANRAKSGMVRVPDRWGLSSLGFGGVRRHGRRTTPTVIDWLSVINVTQKTVDEFCKSAGAEFDKTRERTSRSSAVGDSRSILPNTYRGCEDAETNEQRRAAAKSC
jgi:hypothetical protein